MSTALQKPWMKDLPKATVAFAKQQAIKATHAWNDTVEGILTAAKAIFEVRERIGGKGKGSFSAWAEEELKRSNETASALADIGARYTQFLPRGRNLPPSWTVLRELTRANSDEVFAHALRRVQPEMTRAEVFTLVGEIEQDYQEEKPKPKKKQKPKVKAATPAKHEQVTVSATPKHAAKQLTVSWKQLHEYAGLICHTTVRDRGALSPEAARFLLHQYVRPITTLLSEVEQCLVSQ